MQWEYYTQGGSAIGPLIEWNIMRVESQPWSTSVTSSSKINVSKHLEGRSGLCVCRLCVTTCWLKSEMTMRKHLNHMKLRKLNCLSCCLTLVALCWSEIDRMENSYKPHETQLFCKRASNIEISRRPALKILLSSLKQSTSFPLFSLKPVLLSSKIFRFAEQLDFFID